MLVCLYLYALSVQDAFVHIIDVSVKESSPLGGMSWGPVTSLALGNFKSYERGNQLPELKRNWMSRRLLAHSV
jgi:hypothetical protein